MPAATPAELAVEAGLAADEVSQSRVALSTLQGGGVPVDPTNLSVIVTALISSEVRLRRIHDQLAAIEPAPSIVKE